MCENMVESGKVVWKGVSSLTVFVRILHVNSNGPKTATPDDARNEHCHVLDGTVNIGRSFGQIPNSCASNSCAIIHRGRERQTDDERSEKFGTHHGLGIIISSLRKIPVADLNNRHGKSIHKLTSACMHASIPRRESRQTPHDECTDQTLRGRPRRRRCNWLALL